MQSYLYLQPAAAIRAWHIACFRLAFGFMPRAFFFPCDDSACDAGPRGYLGVRNGSCRCFCWFAWPYSAIKVLPGPQGSFCIFRSRSQYKKTVKRTKGCQGFQWVWRTSISFIRLSDPSDPSDWRAPSRFSISGSIDQSSATSCCHFLLPLPADSRLGPLSQVSPSSNSGDGCPG